jgi:hypothetical protein
MGQRWRIFVGLGAGLLLIAGGVVLVSYLTSARYVRHAEEIDTYERTEDPKQIAVHFLTGSWDLVDEPTVREFPERIVMTVWVSRFVPPPGQFTNLAARRNRITVTLRSPLGERRVVDGISGRPVPTPQEPAR